MVYKSKISHILLVSFELTQTELKAWGKTYEMRIPYHKNLQIIMIGVEN